MNGEPAFLSGANYIPSAGWLPILENWNAGTLERDFAALRTLGVRAIRFPPLWPLLQPEPGRVDPEILARLNELVTLAHRNGLAVQVGPITGWMSGAAFLPVWVDRNLFTDERTIRATRELVRQVAAGLKNNPGLQGYDFGNETDALAAVLGLDLTAAQANRWMDAIYQAYKEADPGHPVTNGVGGFGQTFDVPGLQAASDYLSVHSYPYFNGTHAMDSWIGQRTTYSSSYLISYAAVAGKPVLLQEIGCSESWVPRKDIGKFLRLTLMDSWAEGAAGYYWWGSHDIAADYHPPARLMRLPYSKPSFAQGRFDELEYSMGLLDIHNRPKPYAEEFERWSAVIRKLGLGWQDDLPVWYLLHPATPAGDAPSPAQITAWALAKQAHVRVRVWPEDQPVPADAGAVVVPGFGLSAEGKQHVKSYLEGGGVVYQSGERDFAADRLAFEGEAVSAQLLTAEEAAGSICEGQKVRIGAPLKARGVKAGGGVRILLRAGAAGVFFRTEVGKGTYYYLAGDLEQALGGVWNPWEEDDSHLIYSVLRSGSGIDLEGKQVEVFVKTRGAERLIFLLNHSGRSAGAVVRGTAAVRLIDFFSGAAAGSGREIPVQLMPAEVRLLRVEATE